jgi:hypothetical protein
MRTPRTTPCGPHGITDTDPEQLGQDLLAFVRERTSSAAAVPSVPA